MNDVIIKAARLTKRYNDLVAVDGIDCEICSGETFGFLGPNGAGKTTFMKMIYCFILPDGGTLEVDGLNVLDRPRQVKNILGVVPQEDSLDPDISVRENLTLYGRYFDIPIKISGPRADELIEMMSLTEKRDTIIEELSGGMKRRLMIIRGLINKPKILILDEPTTGLDPQARHLVWQKLRLLKKSGITILLTTHYMEEAAQLCDRLVMMHHTLLMALPSLVDKNGYYEMAGDRLYIYSQNADYYLNKIGLSKSKSIIKRAANLEDVFLRLSGRGLVD
jgi:lipooligosaccharide transport system ATP-binding protein